MITRDIFVNGELDHRNDIHAREIRKHLKHRGDDVALHEEIVRTTAQGVACELRRIIVEGRQKAHNIKKVVLRLPKRSIYHVTARREWERELQSAINDIMIRSDGINVKHLTVEEDLLSTNPDCLKDLTCGAAHCIDEDLLMDQEIEQLQRVNLPLSIFGGIVGWLSFGLLPCCAIIQLSVRKNKGLRTAFWASIEACDHVLQNTTGEGTECLAASV